VLSGSVGPDIDRAHFILSGKSSRSVFEQRRCLHCQSIFLAILWRVDVFLMHDSLQTISTSFSQGDFYLLFVEESLIVPISLQPPPPKRGKQISKHLVPGVMPPPRVILMLLRDNRLFCGQKVYKYAKYTIQLSSFERKE